MSRAVSTIEAEALAIATAAPMLAQVRTWSAINSGSHNLDGLARMASLLADACAALPGALALVEAEGHGRNLHLAVRPEAPVQLLLTGHMDTVYGADHPFQSVAPIDEAGTINGPGVADMKGGIAVLLAALHAFESTPLASRLGYELVINSDEEIGSPGSSPLIARAARGKHAALTYEPSLLPDGTFACSRPGSGNFAVTVTGRAAHAGRNPQDGRNAILAACDLALQLAKTAGPGLTVNPARIEGGGPNNVVPDHAVLHFNVRPLTHDDEAIARAAIDDIIAAVTRRHDVTMRIDGDFGRPPKPFDPRTEQLFELVRRCGVDLGLPVAWKPGGGVCDGNNIAACGVPVIDTMGVRGGAIHSPDEYLIVESLAERARLSTLALLRLAAGELP